MITMIVQGIMIGNLVNFTSTISNETKIIKVDWTWFGNEADQKDSSPIPLTPDILEKLGFETINHKFEGTLYKKSWLKCNERMTGWEWRGGYIPEGPKSFHQLQNLYFALTGEELNTTKLLNQ